MRVLRHELIDGEVFAMVGARRLADGWHYTTHAGFDAVIELSDPPCRLLLAEVYADAFERPAEP